MDRLKKEGDKGRDFIIKFVIYFEYIELILNWWGVYGLFFFEFEVFFVGRWWLKFERIGYEMKLREV